MEDYSKIVIDKIDHVKCPICLDSVENVRELPCRHIFCFNCLETYKREKEAFVCPLCKKEISKRKLLTRDAALESLSIFFRTLGDDVKLHHKTDIRSFLSDKFKKKDVNNILLSKSDSNEIIPQSSEEKLIPCTSKVKDTKMLLKKKNVNISNMNTKTVLKSIQLDSKKNSSNDQNRKTKSKVGLSCKQKKIDITSKQNSSHLNLMLKNKQNFNRPFKNKNKILQWLHDSRNDFERFSQTQSFSTQTNTPLDIDMSSVSQIYVKNTQYKKTEPGQDIHSVLKNNEKITRRKTCSVHTSPMNKPYSLRRHSLECTSSIKLKQYHDLQQMNCIENQLLINLIEDEVLNAIDEEILSESNRKKTSISTEKQIEKNAVNEEDTFLDQLDNEMLEVPKEEMKKNSSRQRDMNTTSTHIGNKSKSSWKSIKKLKKTIGKTKAPKMLDISLQSTQKINKKETGSKLHTMDPSKIANTTENKTVDFQKLEDYFSRTLPQMMEINTLQTSSQDFISTDDVHEQNLKQNIEQEIDNDSDIYVHQTQPLTGETIDPKIDKISYVAKLTEKLKNILRQLIIEDNIQTNELSSIFPSIETICNYLKIDNKKNCASQKKIVANEIGFIDKQIQTEIISSEGVPITSFTACKSLVHEDVEVQTVQFCSNCPHVCSDENPKKFTHTASSPIIFPIKTIENEEKRCTSNMKAQNKLSIEIGHDKLNPEIKNDKVQSQVEDLLVKQMKYLEKEASQNVNMPRIPIGSEIPVEQILEQCNTQVNSAKENEQNILSDLPNISTICRIESTDKNLTQGSGILCSLPQSNSRVNRKLLFQKAMLERKELEQNLKRVRSENSTSDNDEERPYKVKCNRFLQDHLSIEFESDSLQDYTQYSKNSVVLLEQTSMNSSKMKNESLPDSNIKNKSENYLEKMQFCENTQANTLVNYCDQLIAKANNQISNKDTYLNDINMDSSINHSNSSNGERLDQTSNKKHFSLETLKAKEQIKTQDLLEHYDDLIEKANKQIETESNRQHLQKISYNTSQIPTTSKHFQVLEKEELIEQKKEIIKTQDLLDHCNSLIEKTTKQIERNELNKSNIQKNEFHAQSENDDEFFCQNLEQFDSVLEKVESRLILSEEKFSESLFELCKENLSTDLENKSIAQTDNILRTPKRIKSVVEAAAIKNNKKPGTKGMKRDGANSSDDEIFSDMDLVETTPQKSTTFLDRLTCSQVVNKSRTSLRIQEDIENFPPTMNIVPPPPGFDDETENKIDTEKVLMNSEKESENVIPNSLSPEKVRSKNKPLIATHLNNERSNVLHEAGILSQQFMKMSPICKEKSKNLNVIEMARQSKFSPLTITPKTTSIMGLTSTPKQKSILNYVKPKLKSSQETSILAREMSKPCIAFSRLNNAETLCVISLCNKNLATRQDKFNHDVTHMIVSVDRHNYVKDHTIKFISAIAAGIWVLNIKWVQECLSLNRIIDEEPFEVLDITGIPSPRISRLSHLTNPLLKGFKFYLPRPFTQTSVDDVKNIIQLQQGVVVTSLEELKDQNDYIRIVISELVDTEDYHQYEDWLSSYKIVTVDINWLSLSVSRYKILSVRPHLLCSDDSIDELGYPSNLVLDVAPSLTQDVTYN